MARRRQRDDEPSLFDLPLSPDAAAPEESVPPDAASEPEAPPVPAGPTEWGESEEPSVAARGAQVEEPVALPLFDEEDAPGWDREPALAPEAAGAEPFDEDAEATPNAASAPAPPAAAGPAPAPVTARFLGGLADLAVHLAVALSLLFGARLLGARADLGAWPPLALFLAVFSLLYTVVALAFWGRTPGMAWAGLVARTTSGLGLTFGQATRRWAAGLLTALLAGLPTLVALAGDRSLADRLSDSVTLLDPDER